MQSYKKSRAEQKILLFFLPRPSKFANFIGKVTDYFFYDKEK